MFKNRIRNDLNNQYVINCL